MKKPKPREKYIIVRASDEEHKKVQELAAREGLSVSSWVRRLIYSRIYPQEKEG
jgi:predicted HicB family RNase H-like nuclease